MALHIDYYVSLSSPWTYLGSARIEALVKQYGATMRIYPIDFREVFSETGGLPLRQRSPQRQAYRLQELARWSEFLNVPINIQPSFFPAIEPLAAGCVIATREEFGDEPAIKLAHRILKGVWVDEEDISVPHTMTKLIADIDGLDPQEVMLMGFQQRFEARRKSETKAAIQRGVFGAPSYVIGNEIFWGQDRLDFVQRRLAKG